MDRVLKEVEVVRARSHFRRIDVSVLAEIVLETYARRVLRCHDLKATVSN